MINRRRIRKLYRKSFSYFKTAIFILAIILIYTGYSRAASSGKDFSISGLVQDATSTCKTRIDGIQKAFFPNTANDSVKKLNINKESSVEEPQSNDDSNRDPYIALQDFCDYIIDSSPYLLLLLIVLILDIYVINIHTRLLLASPERRKNIRPNLLYIQPESQKPSLDMLESNVRINAYLREKLEAVKEGKVDELVPVHEKQLRENWKSIENCYRTLVQTNKAWEARQCLHGS